MAATPDEQTTSPAPAPAPAPTSSQEPAETEAVQTEAPASATPRARPQFPRLLRQHRAQLRRPPRPHERSHGHSTRPANSGPTSGRPSGSFLRFRIRQDKFRDTGSVQADAPASPAPTSESVSSRTRAANIKPDPRTLAGTGNIGRFTPDRDCTRSYLHQPNADEPEHSPCILRAHREPGTSALADSGEHQSNADEPRCGRRIGPADFEPGSGSL